MLFLFAKITYIFMRRKEGASIAKPEGTPACLLENPNGKRRLTGNGQREHIPRELAGR
jgi:hypothetical protein